jgi:hypothetical protein
MPEVRTNLVVPSRRGDCSEADVKVGGRAPIANYFHPKVSNDMVLSLDLVIPWRDVSQVEKKTWSYFIR